MKFFYLMNKMIGLDHHVGAHKDEKKNNVDEGIQTHHTILVPRILLGLKVQSFG